MLIEKELSYEEIKNINSIAETMLKRTMLHEAGKDSKTPIMGMVQQDGKAKLFVIGSITFLLNRVLKLFRLRYVQ